jgi:hypothetical protein
LLVVYVAAAPPAQPLDRKRIDRRIDELNHERFTVRDGAMQELAKLGYDLKPILRAALKDTRRPLEWRRRVEALLEKLPGVVLADLDLPNGIKVVDGDDLAARNLRELRNPDRQQRSFAVQELGGLADTSAKVVPALAEVLTKDKDEHVRRCAAAGLAWVGPKARPALAALKAGLDDADAYVRDACRRAVDAVAKAQDGPANNQEAQRQESVREAIRKFKNAR